MVADTERAHGGGKLPRGRHCEPEGDVGVREIVDEVGTARRRNVAAVVAGAATHGGEAAVVGSLDHDRAVEHHEIRFIEVLAQPRRGHERVKGRRGDLGLGNRCGIGLGLRCPTTDREDQSHDERDVMPRDVGIEHQYPL